jgi:hypothetical protein
VGQTWASLGRLTVGWSGQHGGRSGSRSGDPTRGKVLPPVGSLEVLS